MNTQNVNPSATDPSASPSTDEEIRTGAAGLDRVEPPLKPNDKNAAAAAQLLRHIARSAE